MMEIVIIAAISENGVIGVDGGIPWHYPEDLSHFKNTTIGHPVIMGRKTFESIVARLGGPLPERRNIVLSRRTPNLPDDVLHASSVDDVLELVQELEQEPSTAYVMGGASVYEQFLPYAEKLVITEVHSEFEGDVYFPEWDKDNWEEIERESRDKFDFVEYVRSDCWRKSAS